MSLMNMRFYFQHARMEIFVFDSRHVLPATVALVQLSSREREIERVPINLHMYADSIIPVTVFLF